MNDHWEMRLKNLLWTVSGDYSLEMSFEDDKWEENSLGSSLRCG